MNEISDQLQTIAADSLTWTNGQGVSLAYAGTAPDIGAYEYYNPVYYVPFRKP